MMYRRESHEEKCTGEDMACNKICDTDCIYYYVPVSIGLVVFGFI